MVVKSILAALKSLKLALRQSFVLKSQCNVLREALELLEADVKNDPDWYEGGEKLCDQLLRFLKKFLRFARINLKVTEARSKGLGDLRKARSLCNVMKLREKLNTFSSELQLLVFSSKIQQRIGQQVGQLLSGMSLANAYNADKSQIIVLFEEVFESLQKLPDMGDAKRVYDSLILPLTHKDPYDVNIEDFDDPQLSDFSHKLEHRLLGMTTQDPTPFEALKMDKLYRSGKFGEIYTGTLGGPVPVCIQKIKPEKLQTLSSDGRIKLFSTVRTNLVKGHDNLVKVIGVTLHDDTLYVSLQNINFSLSDWLHGVGNVGPRSLTPNDLLYTFYCITSALEFLQKDGVVHGDLTPENIFFSREATKGFVRLANFSYELNLEELHWSTWNDESIAYQAPEVLGQKSFSAASDVYALAICIWESTQDNKRPFAEMDKTHLVEEVKAGARPNFTGNTKEAGWLVDLAQRCWSPRPWVRPGVTAIKNELGDIATRSGKDMETLGSFVAPLVKKTQQEMVSAGKMQPSGSLMLNGDRPLPAIKAPPSPPRVVPDVPMSPPRPTEKMRPPPSPVRDIPQIPDTPTPDRALPPPPPPTSREIPAPPINRLVPPPPPTNREVPPPPPAENTRALPPPPSDNTRALPPPPAPTNNRPLPPSPADAPPSPPRTMPEVPLSPPRPLPPSPERPIRDRKLPPRPMPPENRRPLPEVQESSDTLHRVQDEYKNDEPAPTSPNVPTPQATGVNGLTAEEVRRELIRFYEENDPDMLKELNNLVNWCMVNGLEQFEKLLVERFGKGLPMFSGEQESEPEQASQPASRGRGGLASIFTRRNNGKPKQPSGGRALPSVPQRPPGLFKP